jgi:hypothetical protein
LYSYNGIKELFDGGSMKKQLFIAIGIAVFISLAGCQNSQTKISNVSDGKETGENVDNAIENTEVDVKPSSEEGATENIITNNETENIDSNKEVIDHESGVTITFVDKSREIKDENGLLLLTVTGNMPVITVPGNQIATDKINEYYNEKQKEKEELINEYVQYAKDDYGYLGKERLEYWNGYALGDEYTAARVDSSIISIVEEVYEYVGGAHPNSYRLAQNFDTQTGELLSLTDVLTDMDQGRKFINDYLLKLLKASEEELGLFDNYEESVGEILTDNTWYLSNEGFVIICNEYIVSPHAAGIQEFVIPYKDLTYLVEKYQKN